MSDPRNQLFREYVRLLRGLQPRVFVMENVSGMVKGKMKLIFADILRELKASGYRVSARLMNAMYFNVPQSRQRMIFVGVREDVGIGPSHPVAKYPPIPLRDAFQGASPDGKPLGEFLSLMACHQPHGLWSSHMQTWERLKGNLGSSLSTKWATWDDPSGTLIKEWIAITGIVHPDRHRYCNTEELKRIASFPDAFALTGSFDDITNRLGNSVPPLFMRSIASHIREHILNA